MHNKYITFLQCDTIDFLFYRNSILRIFSVAMLEQKYMMTMANWLKVSDKKGLQTTKTQRGKKPHPCTGKSMTHQSTVCMSCFASPKHEMDKHAEVAASCPS